MNQKFEAERLFEPARPVKTMSEYEREQQAIRDNYHRLRLERQAREAAASK